jgi:hypothetical protein
VVTWHFGISGFFLLSGATLGLERLQLPEGFIQVSLQTLFVKTQVGEGLGVATEYARGGERCVDLRMFGVDFARGFEVDKKEHRIFEGSGAIQAPLGVAASLGVHPLKRGFRREVEEELTAEGFVRFHVFVRHNDGAASKTVAHRVQRGPLLAFVGAGTGDLLG